MHRVSHMLSRSSTNLWSVDTSRGSSGPCSVDTSRRRTVIWSVDKSRCSSGPLSTVQSVLGVFSFPPPAMWMWGCIPFYNQQCGCERVSLFTANCVHGRKFSVYSQYCGCGCVFLSTAVLMYRVHPCFTARAGRFRRTVSTVSCLCSLAGRYGNLVGLA